MNTQRPFQLVPPMLTVSGRGPEGPGPVPAILPGSTLAIIDIVSVSRYMVVGGEPVAVVPPGSPPYYYRYYPLYMVTSRDC